MYFGLEAQEVRRNKKTNGKKKWQERLRKHKPSAFRGYLYRPPPPAKSMWYARQVRDEAK